MHLIAMIGRAIYRSFSRNLNIEEFGSILQQDKFVATDTTMLLLMQFVRHRTKKCEYNKIDLDGTMCQRYFDFPIMTGTKHGKHVIYVCDLYIHWGIGLLFTFDSIE